MRPKVLSSDDILNRLRGDQILNILSNYEMTFQVTGDNSAQLINSILMETARIYKFHDSSTL